jgi:hypothetical protein
MDSPRPAPGNRVGSAALAGHDGMREFVAAVKRRRRRVMSRLMRMASPIAGCFSQVSQRPLRQSEHRPVPQAPHGTRDRVGRSCRKVRLKPDVTDSLLSGHDWRPPALVRARRTVTDIGKTWSL